MKHHLVILAATLVLVDQSLAQQTCHSADTLPYRSFADLSLYDEAVPSFADNVPGCAARMIFMMVRNGVRTPNRDDILDFNNRLPGLRDRILRSRTGQLCQQDLDRLQAWRFEVNASNADQLTTYGFQQTQRLAGRLQQQYPGLLNQRNSADRFVIRHAYSNDDTNTATAFAEGLGLNASQARGPTAQERDLLLQFSASCENDDNDADDILEDFFEMQEVKDMITGITSRLGLQPDSVTFDDINAMYRMCAYGFALSDRSPWCAAFIRRDLEILELKEDVVSAELYGYEDEINQLETCVLAKDLVDRLKDGMNDLSSLPPVVLYFANTQAVLPFMTRLGLFKDDLDLEFDDDGSVQSLSNRKWKTSEINPFMANVGLVLYQCLSEFGPTFKVKALVNELPEIMDECSTTVCPMEEFLEIIEDFAEDCSYEELCDGVSTITVSYAAITFMSLFSLFYTCVFS